MKSGDPDKVSRVRQLLKKLGELADVLDDVSRKMRLAAEKQKAGIESGNRPEGERARLIDKLQEQLKSIDKVSLDELQISKAQEISERLIDTQSQQGKPEVGGSRKMTFHEYIEFSSLDEFKKFRNLPAISKKDAEECDWDRLLADLYSG